MVGDVVQQQRLAAQTMLLADRPGAHVPQQILRNINGLWNKSISGKRTKNRKTGGFNLPKEVSWKTCSQLSAH